MNRREWLRLAAGAPLLPAWRLSGADGVPAHPSKLRFPDLDYQPPKPEGYRRDLGHGAVGYFVEDRQLPLVKISLIIRTGDFVVPRDLTGLASLTGSQIRSGGTKTLGPDEFDERADFLAAQISSGIGDTSGSASLDCLRKNLDESLKLFFDMLKNPGFDAERFELARRQTLQSMERRNDSTSSIERREWARLLRGSEHFSARLSTKSTIEAVTREKMMEFHQRYYHPSSFIFAVSGDFDTEEMADRLGEALAAGWPGTKPEVPPVPAPDHTPRPGVYMADKDDVNQSRVSIGHLGIKRENPDHIPVYLMNELLGGGGFTSRIMSRVRSDEGLAYSAGSRYRPGIYYPGTFRAGFQSRNPSCARATAIVLEEINRTREQKVPTDQLETAKNYAIEIFPRFFATASRIAGTFAEDEYTDREEGYWQKYRGRIAAVTADDVLRVAQEYVRPEGFVFLVTGHVDQVLEGDPDYPQYSFKKIAEDGIHHIPLPDPLPMESPETAEAEES